jgi:hypothetical protein
MMLKKLFFYLHIFYFLVFVFSISVMSQKRKTVWTVINCAHLTKMSFIQGWPYIYDTDIYIHILINTYIYIYSYLDIYNLYETNKLFLFWETAQRLQRTAHHIQERSSNYFVPSFSPRPHNWAAELSDMPKWQANADFHTPGTFSSAAPPRKHTSHFTAFKVNRVCLECSKTA